MGPRKKKVQGHGLDSLCAYEDHMQVKYRILKKSKYSLKLGLVWKIIKFFSDDGEKDLCNKLTSEDSENGSFRKLKGCGGFELLQCAADCKDLEILKCAISVKELKHRISSQGKIYIRPIQRSFSTIPLVPQRNESKIKEKCSICSDIFYVKDLRKHFLTCCP